MSATSTRQRTLTNHEPSWWLRAQLDNLIAGWETNGIRPCPHLRRDPGRGVGVTALYLPDVLACPDRCLDVFKLTGPADFRCDRCHEQSEGLAGIVYETALDRLRLLIMFGLCARCEVKELGR